MTKDFEIVVVDDVRYLKDEAPEAVAKVTVDVEEKQAPKPANKARRATDKEA